MRFSHDTLKCKPLFDVESTCEDSLRAATTLATCLETVVVLIIKADAFVLEDIKLLVAARCTTAVGVEAASAGRLVVDVNWLLAGPLVCSPLEAAMAIINKSPCQIGENN